LRNIFGPFQRIRNQHKILRFFIPHNNMLTKVFWSNLHFLANFECIRSKNGTFLNILNLFFANIYQSQFESDLALKIEFRYIM
jgi:hypothetical protein